MTDYARDVTGSLFVAAGVMSWLGWQLLPRRPGAFFEPDDFAAIRARFRPWIWLYRLHIFGYLVTLMAFAALAMHAAGDARVLIWPGVAVIAAGALVGALGSAFYYHMGAWGALELQAKGREAAHEFIGSLRVGTHYATCLIRFSRVFFGLGQVVLAFGLAGGGIVPLWLAGAAAVLGLAAMIVTMALPDALESYRPIFHLNALWLAVTGIVLWQVGAGGA